ncbi:MAG: peptide-methionine (S)-S-oxide reductase MsrA [Bryobacteraceae bacterium]|nr:peptide-methionine (S)-S-oxide reductase MsrA [Bryobacteraceae bacterium]
MKWSVFALAGLSVVAAEIPEPAVDEPLAAAKGRQVAVLAGGCFWCTEAVFEMVEGVQKVVSGYSGGEAKDANYRAVSTGQINHAEAVEITYDPSKVTYGQLLKVFFNVAHDPTQLNRQGPDYGRQYRSAVFYKDAGQKRIAEAYIKQLTEAKVFAKPIVTELAAFKAFYPAEEYHQDYAQANPVNGYIRVNAAPKVEKLKKACPRLVRKK